MKQRITKYKLDRKLLRQFEENSRIMTILKNKAKS
jgi:hypothetical protein